MARLCGLLVWGAVWCCSDDGCGIKKPNYGVKDVNNILALKKRMKTKKKKKNIPRTPGYVKRRVLGVTAHTLLSSPVFGFQHHRISGGAVSQGNGGSLLVTRVHCTCHIHRQGKKNVFKNYNNYKLLNIPVESI